MALLALGSRLFAIGRHRKDDYSDYNQYLSDLICDIWHLSTQVWHFHQLDHVPELADQGNYSRNQ